MNVSHKQQTLPELFAKLQQKRKAMDLVTCKICYINFIDFVGECGHPMCKECLLRLHKEVVSADVLLCPFCRHVYNQIEIYN